MSKTIAINGTRLDEVHLPLEPYSNGAVAYLKYPMSEIRFSRDDDRLCLVLPAYLSVELYRIGILPQDVNTPVEISISGRSAGRFVVSDVRFAHWERRSLRASYLHADPRSSRKRSQRRRATAVAFRSGRKRDARNRHHALS